MIDEIFREIIEAANTSSFIQEIRILSKGIFTLKVHLIISEELKVQIYRNSKTDNQNYVLLLENERIYWRDKYHGKWHLHPADDPTRHEDCEEVSISTFLDEVREILIRLELI